MRSEASLCSMLWLADWSRCLQGTRNLSSGLLSRVEHYRDTSFILGWAFRLSSPIWRISALRESILLLHSRVPFLEWILKLLIHLLSLRMSLMFTLLDPRVNEIYHMYDHRGKSMFTQACGWILPSFATSGSSIWLKTSYCFWCLHLGMLGWNSLGELSKFLASVDRLYSSKSWPKTEI